MTDIESVRTAAIGALPVIVVLPILSVWAYQFDGIYIGATAGAAMLGTAITNIINAKINLGFKF